MIWCGLIANANIFIKNLLKTISWFLWFMLIISYEYLFSLQIDDYFACLHICRFLKYFSKISEFPRFQGRTWIRIFHCLLFMFKYYNIIIIILWYYNNIIYYYLIVIFVLFYNKFCLIFPLFCSFYELVLILFL